MEIQEAYELFILDRFTHRDLLERINNVLRISREKESEE